MAHEMPSNSNGSYGFFDDDAGPPYGVWFWLLFLQVTLSLAIFWILRKMAVSKTLDIESIYLAFSKIVVFDGAVEETLYFCDN